MNPGPLAMATATERASELARTAAARKAVVRRRARREATFSLPAMPALQPAPPAGC